MGFFARLFNWRTLVEATVQQTLNNAIYLAKEQVEQEENWTDDQKIALKTGMDILAAKVMGELSSRLK